MKKYIKFLILAIILMIGVGLSFFYGINLFIRILLVSMLADYLIGIAMALSGNSKHGRLKSSVGYTGIVKKSTMIFIVIIMGLLEQLLMIDFLQKTISIAFIINEILSILENAERLGLPVKLITKILKIKKENEDDKNQ